MKKNTLIYVMFFMKELQFIQKAILFVFLLISSLSFGQLAETENNDTPTASGVLKIYDGQQISGGILTEPGDRIDYWQISKITNDTSVYNITVNDGPSSEPDLFLEMRDGAYDGPLLSKTLIITGGGGNGAFTLDYSTGDRYYLLVAEPYTVGSTEFTGTYYWTFNGFSPDNCTPETNNDTTVDITSVTESSLFINGLTFNQTLSSFDLVNVIFISDTNDFSSIADGFNQLSPNTSYSGSGVQLVYKNSDGRIANPNVEVTGLSPGTTYYVKAMVARECQGFYYFTTGSTDTALTCGSVPSAATAMTINSTGETQLNLSSITSGPTSGYVVKINTTNSFTNPANGNTLPSANTVYGGGEQVVYANASATPNITITGLTSGTTYYFKVFGYNSCGGTYYFETTGFESQQTTCRTPVGNSELPYFRPSLHWENRVTPHIRNVPAGVTGHVVKINTVNSFTDITGVQNSLPTANTTYSGSGEQVILAGTSGEDYAFSAHGLLPNTEYFFKTYSYYLCEGQYYFSATSHTTSTYTSGVTDKLASNVSISNLTGTALTIDSFTGAPAADNGRGIPHGYIIKMNTTNSFTPLNFRDNMPAANTAYSGSGEQVIYSNQVFSGAPSTTPNLTITGLTAGVTYYFTVYAINHTGAPYYFNSFQQIGYEFTVENKLPQTITFNALGQQTYGNENFNLTATASSSLPVSYTSSNTAVATISGSTVTIVGAGTTTITASQSGDATYGAAPNVQQNLIVGKRGITVTADAVSKSYGDVDNLTYQITSGSLINGDNLSGALGRAVGTDIGTYAINQGTLNSSNYDITFVGNDLTITKRAVTVTANAITKTETLADPVLTYQITSGSLAFSDAFTGTLSRTAGETIGIYPISQGTLALTNNYDLTFVGSNFTITAAEPATGLHFDGVLGVDYDYITVPDNNDLDFSTSFTFEAWVNFDFVSRADDGWDWMCIFAKSRFNESYGLMLNIDPAFDKTLRFYHAGLDGQNNTDYVWNSVQPNTWYHIAVTLSEDQATIYINGVPVATQSFLPGDTLTPNNNPLYIGANRTLGADPYPFGGKMDELRLWNITRTQQQINDNKTKVLGSNTSGLVLNYRLNQGNADLNNTTISSVLDNTSNGYNGTLHNFALNGATSNFVRGYSGVSSKEDQTITFNPLATKTYGDTTFDLTATASSGLAVTYTSSDTSVATVSGNTVTIVGNGTTTITASQAGSESFSPAADVAQVLTVNKRAVEITVDAKTKEFGNSDPELTYQITSGSLVDGDAFTGSLTRVAGEDVGDYVIGQGSLVLNNNYMLSFVGDNLSITPRAIEVTADTKTKIYGATDPELTYQITSGSLVGSDAFTGNLARVAGEDVGTYAINQGTLALNSNYTITYVNNNISIIARPIEITADIKTKTYGDTDPELTYQITSGNLVGSDVFTGDLTRMTGEGVGNYAILRGSVTTSNNYNVAFVSNNLSITKRTIEITAEAKTKAYGDADPALTYQITGGVLQFGDTLDGSLARVAGEDAGTYAIEQGSVTAGGNYTITFVSDDFTITQRAIEVTADAKTKVYGDADPALTYQITSGSLVNSDAFTGALSRAAGENVGNYAITQGTLTAGTNYLVNFVGADLEITKVNQVITFNTLPAKAYGDANFNLNATSDSGLGVTYISSNTSVATISGSTVKIVGAGSTTITASQAGNTNVNAATDVPQVLVVDKKELVVTPAVTSVEYGFIIDQSGTVPLNVTGFVNGDDINILTPSGNRYRVDYFDNSLTTLARNIGTYTNGTRLLGSNAPYNAHSNYRFVYPYASIEIVPREVTVTANANQTKVYGDTDPTLVYTLTPLPVTDSALGLLYDFSSFALSGNLARVAGEDVGTYAINQGTLDTTTANYNVTFVADNFEITKRTIEVTADAKNKVYGDADPVLTYQITTGSLVNSDAFTGSLTRAAGENAGTYAINQGSLALSSNYTLTYVSDNLSITKRAIEVTADAKNKVYGAADPALTYQITSGSLVNSDAFTGSLTRAAGENAGTYAINQGSLALSSNYTLTYVSGNLSITKRAIEVTAGAKNKVYGAADPALTYQITTGSLVNSDAFTGSLTRAAGENVGTYAINQGSLALSSNYTLTYVSDNLSITKRAIEVTADAKNKVYGAADPTLTYQITTGSLVNSDAFTGSLTRAAGENVGTYAINQGSLALSSNYTLTYVSDNLSITKRAIEVTADAKNKVYGAVDPTLTYQITSGSLVNSDAFTGALTRAAGENVGDYAINQGSLALSSNYTLTYVSDNLSITKRAIEVTADAKSKIEGESDPALTYQITSGSLVNSDVFTGSLSRASGETFGDYAISQGTLALSANYAITFVGNTFTINRDGLARWDGSTSSVWNVATNWEGDVTPIATDNYVIPNVATTPNITSGIVAQMNSLTVESSSSLTISSDGAAVIETNFDNSGTVAISAIASSSGTMIVKGTSNGMVSYERGGLVANKWSIVSAPVVGQSIKDFVENPANNIRMNTSVTPNRYAVGYYDDSRPTGDKWVYYTVDDLVSNSITFEKGRSYAISRATDGSVSFTGTIETTDATKSTVASQWNAIGNPYTAYLPINENSGTNFINDNLASFDPAYVGAYVWDNAQNKYVAKTLVSGASSLAPGQGFFVKTTTGVSSISFKEAQRMTQPVSGGTFSRGAGIPTIELSVTNNDVKVNTTISYRTNATKGLDAGYDVGNFDGAELDIYTKLLDNSSDKNFTFQSLPLKGSESYMIPLGIKAKEGASILISAKGTSLPVGMEIYLEDKELGKFINLSEETYQIIGAASMEGRFYVHAKAQVDIPEVSIHDVKIYNADQVLFVDGIQGEEFKVTMYNTAGMLVYKESFKGTGKNSIALPRVETGVYIVRVATHVGMKSKKIILKK